MGSQKRISDLENAVSVKPDESVIMAMYDPETPDLFEVNGQLMTEAEVRAYADSLAGPTTVIFFLPKTRDDGKPA